MGRFYCDLYAIAGFGSESPEMPELPVPVTHEDQDAADARCGRAPCRQCVLSVIRSELLRIRKIQA